MDLRQDTQQASGDSAPDGEIDPTKKPIIEATDMKAWENQLEKNCERLSTLEKKKETDELKKEKADLLHEAFDKIMENTVTLAFQDGTGSRLVQKALQLADNEMTFKLACCFKDQVIKAIRSKHANHVLAEIIEKMNLSVSMEWFIDEIMVKPHEYAVHPYGCRIFVRMVDHWLTDTQPATQHVRAKLVNFLTEEKEMFKLMKDRFGTHIIRKFWEQEIHRESIVKILENHAFDFAQDTYGSFFVEVAIKEMKATHLGAEIWKRDGALETLNKLPGGRFVIKQLETTCNYPVKDFLPEGGRITRPKKSEQKSSLPETSIMPPIPSTDEMDGPWNYSDIGLGNYWGQPGDLAPYPLAPPWGMLGYGGMPMDWNQSQNYFQPWNQGYPYFQTSAGGWAGNQTRRGKGRSGGNDRSKGKSRGITH